MTAIFILSLPFQSDFGRVGGASLPDRANSSRLTARLRTGYFAHGSIFYNIGGADESYSHPSVRSDRRGFAVRRGPYAGARARRVVDQNRSGFTESCRHRLAQGYLSHLARP